jgi:hypothetical protein
LYVNVLEEIMVEVICKYGEFLTLFITQYSYPENFKMWMWTVDWNLLDAAFTI